MKNILHNKKDGSGLILMNGDTAGFWYRGGHEDGYGYEEGTGSGSGLAVGYGCDIGYGFEDSYEPYGIDTYQ